jgi:hypothetical protein
MSGIQPRRGNSVNRGGTSLLTGKIGHVTPVRQTMLMPGETINARISGQVKMEMLRERDALRLNAHIAHFMTPVRWLWPEWTDYIKEGPDTSLTPPTINFTPIALGLSGNLPMDLEQYWHDAIYRIYNEWYKWPEDPDVTTGERVGVNLEHMWTRCRDQGEPSSDADKMVSAPADQFNIQDLAEIQARYQTAVNREVLSFNRYQELLQDTWGVDGSREVDQVPVMISSSQVGVDPRSLPAQDAAGLGQWGSIYDFRVDDSFTITAPEHCILTTNLIVRFAPITEERHPLANPRNSWAVRVGDPYLMGAMPPQIVEIRDCLDSDSNESLGYLPSGWQWRSENNMIADKIDVRDSFPYMKMPTNAAEARKADMRVNAFRSQALEDYVIDLYCNYKSTSMVPAEISSYTVGMDQSSNKTPYTKTRKVK